MTLANWVLKHFEKPLAALIRAVRRAERFLGPEDDWVEEDRRILYEAADSVLRPLGRATIREKGNADYVTTALASADEVERVLMSEGPYQRNVLSTRKYRVDHDGGKQWAVGSLVYDPVDEPWQHHVYLFDWVGGGTDIYAHREASVRDPSEHHRSWQTHGDPKGRVRRILEQNDITTKEHEF